MSSEVPTEAAALREVRSSMVTIAPMLDRADPTNKHTFSGLVIASDGTVLTSRRLVGETTEVEVVFPNGNRFTSKSIAFDGETDIAIIRLGITDKVPFVGWSDMNSIAKGSTVRCMAIGSLDKASVTRGIIAGESKSETAKEPLLLIDHANGPGASCSIVIDKCGKVAGFVAYQPTDSRQAIGRTVAIPHDRIAQVVQELSTKGRVERIRN